MDDEWTSAELTRAILRHEDEIKWLRRLLVGGLTTAVLTGFASSAIIVLTAPG